MKIVAFTGAGISKAAGIPTFAEIPGIKEKLSVEFKQKNPEEFNKAINLLKTNVKDKEPTKAHKILAKLKIPIITMNVDNLHTKAGSDKVIELHGNYIEDNIVLYGEQMHNPQGAINFIIEAVLEAQKNKEEAISYINETAKKSNMDRTELNKGKTGCRLDGLMAINPVNRKRSSCIFR